MAKKATKKVAKKTTKKVAAKKSATKKSNAKKAPAKKSTFVKHQTHLKAGDAAPFLKVKTKTEILFL